MDNSHSVLYNIFNSNVIIHPGCTSAVEAFFSGKKTICHITYRDKGNEQYVPVKVSDLSRNFNQLENLFYNHLKKNKVDKKKDNGSKIFLSNHIFNLSLDSYKIIAKELLKIDIKNENLEMIKEVRKLKENLVSSFLWRIKKKITNLLLKKKINHINKLIKKREKRKFNKLEVQMLKNKFKKLAKIENFKKKISIKKIGNQCFLISK
jgi:hypothetical protein